MKQKRIKLIILIIAILSVQTSFSQFELTENEFTEYSTKLAAQDLEAAIKLENSDSLKEAIPYYKRIAKFDSTSKIGISSIAKLDSIWKTENELFKNQLVGKWRWLWSGTNWETEDSPKKCNCQKYLEFKSNEILVFDNNEIIEVFSYEIEKDFDIVGTSYFFININNREKKWKLRIYNEVENPYYLIERSKNAKLFLSFRDVNIAPNCLCGCPERRFEKINVK